MTTEFFRNSPVISSEFCNWFDQYSDQKIRWSLNPSNIPIRKVDDHWILPIFWYNSDDYWILQEIDDHGILVKFFKDLIRILFKNKMTTEFLWNSSRISIRILVVSLSINSDDYEILQELDDKGILVKFFQDFNQKKIQELDDHRIHMKLFKDFDQNSGCQP